MLVAAELLSQRSVPAETYFVSTTQEEIGSWARSRPRSA